MADSLFSAIPEEELADLLIVSQVEVAKDGSGLVEVVPAEGEKCERCWKHHPLVGAHRTHPTLCPRCAAVIEKMEA